MSTKSKNKFYAMLIGIICLFLIGLNIFLIIKNKTITNAFINLQAENVESKEKLKNLEYWRSIAHLNIHWVGKKINLKDAYENSFIHKQDNMASDLHKVIIYFDRKACAPCLESEMWLWEKHFRKNQTQNLKILAIGAGPEAMDIFAFKKSHKLTFPFIYDEADTFELKGIHSPIVVLVNPKNHIQFVYFPVVGKPQISEQLSSLMLKLVANHS